ncbi:Oidioi.mRNA.OKI2018_I69.chr2.g4605.t1.cds [Oikopleura dioica]|uniref:Oidioi.mRNA.OKI2018_I69.chr2.g4605.t1.cds n=1 Tax=Oikopleura dioica TaxID=34765 RepID=A0ABN7SXF8_OIKDI|nr:Oidioi.mRNA.OKI2018_I69.chr2.g4605.t1.cds [Oikopleura dioica]
MLIECLFCDKRDNQENFLKHLKKDHKIEEFLLQATNGYFVEKQCRECGLAGAENIHKNDDQLENCRKLQTHLKSFGISPCIPPEGYSHPTPENFEGQEEEYDWVGDLYSRLAEAVKLAKKCPLCGLIPKSSKKIEKKIKQHIISRHKIAIYPCRDEINCDFESPWPAELAEHVEEVHRRQITEAEEQGTLYPISVRKENIRKELEKFFTKRNDRQGKSKRKSKTEEPPSLTPLEEISSSRKSALVKNQAKEKSQEKIGKSQKPIQPENQPKETSTPTSNSTSSSSSNPEPANISQPQTSEQKIPEEDDMALDEVIILTPRENPRLTRNQSKPEPSSSDRVKCPFCEMVVTRRGIVQHVGYSHALHSEKFRKDKAYKDILPYKCLSCKLQFAGKESMRKHYNSRGKTKSMCKRPERDDTDLVDPAKNIEYNCPFPKCPFVGKLQLILNHLFRHPAMNVKFRTKKSSLLPVKCHACNFHFTQRSSLQKHIEMNRCERNQMMVQEQEKRKNRDHLHPCPFKCGRLYTSKDKLDEHIEKHHEKEKEVESRIVSQSGSLLKQLKRDPESGKLICPFPECSAVIAKSFSLLSSHIRKCHTRDEYAVFRIIPTTDCPYVCQKCSWAFTEGQIKNHFHQVAAVCTRNKKTRDEIIRKGLDESIVLQFVEPKVVVQEAVDETPQQRIERIFQEKRKISREKEVKDIPAPVEESTEETPNISEKIANENNSNSESQVGEAKRGSSERVVPSLNLVPLLEAKIEPNSSAENLELSDSENEDDTESQQKEDIEENATNDEPTIDKERKRSGHVKIDLSPENTDIPTESREMLKRPREDDAEEVINRTEKEDETGKTEEEANTVANPEVQDQLPVRELVDPVKIIKTNPDEQTQPLTIPLTPIKTPKDKDTIEESVQPPSKKQRMEVDEPIIEAPEASPGQEAVIIEPEQAGTEQEQIEKKPVPVVSENILEPEPIEKIVSPEVETRKSPEEIIKASFPSFETYKFKCCVENACDVQCDTLSELTSHVQIDHSTSDYIRFRATTRYFNFQCQDCGYRSQSQEQHDRHKAPGQVKNCRKFKAFRFNFGISMESDGLPILALNLSETAPEDKKVEILEKCEICSLIFPDQKNLFGHLIESHGIEEYYRIRSSKKARLSFKCDKCSWFFPSAEFSHSSVLCTAQKTITKEIDGDGHECPFCKITLNGKELLHHVDEEHQDFQIIFRLKESKLLKIKCSKCGFHFISNHEKEQHHQKQQCKMNIQAKRDFFTALDGPADEPADLPKTPEPTPPKQANPIPSPKGSIASNSKSPHLILPNLNISSGLSPNLSAVSPTNLASISPTLSIPKKSQQLNSFPFNNQNLQQHQALANALHASFQAHQASSAQNNQQNNPLQFLNQRQNQQYLNTNIPVPNFLTAAQTPVSQGPVNRQILQLDQPNRYGNSVLGTCSYCFVPMRSRQEMVRHASSMQDCLTFAQTCQRASRVPCPYCGEEISGDSKILQNHIQANHSQFYHQFRHMKSVALPFQCIKCNGSFGEMLLLQIHTQSCGINLS